MARRSPSEWFHFLGQANVMSHGLTAEIHSVVATLRLALELHDENEEGLGSDTLACVVSTCADALSYIAINSAEPLSSKLNAVVEKLIVVVEGAQ